MDASQDQFAIRVRDLVVGFGRQTVLDHLSLDVRRGEILGLVGASGGGKSVLMRTIIGLIPRRGGTIDVMLMLINCALGLNTPPVGTTQFVGCAIGGISVGAVMRTILPFYAALIAALMVVTYVPAFSLWLPRLLMGYKG